MLRELTVQLAAKNISVSESEVLYSGRSNILGINSVL